MSTFKTLLKTSITPIALCLSLAIATPALAHKGQNKHHEMRKVLSELSLTDAQKEDIRAIMVQSRQERTLSKSDRQSTKQNLRSLIQSATWNETAVTAAILENQALRQQKALQRATNKNQIWNLLSETQQAEFVSKLELKIAEREQGTNNKRKNKRKNKKLKRLDLSDEQIAAIKTIRSATKESGLATKTKLTTYKAAERALIQNTEFDIDAWQTLNNEYQADFVAMGVLKAKARHDIWNSLTAEQQTKASKKLKGKKRKSA